VAAAGVLVELPFLPAASVPGEAQLWPAAWAARRVAAAGVLVELPFLPAASAPGEAQLWPAASVPVGVRSSAVAWEPVRSCPAEQASSSGAFRADQASQAEPTQVGPRPLSLDALPPALAAASLRQRRYWAPSALER
jgi:hypothetical protein